MKTSTKLITLLITICLAFSLFSGCTITPINNGNISGLGDYAGNVNINVVSDYSITYDDTVAMLENTRPAVYEVYAQKNNSSSISCGSGTVIADNYNAEPAEGEENKPVTFYVLTCHHVIDSNDVYMVKDINGNEFRAKLIGGDSESDIAVICFTPEEDGYSKVQNGYNEFKNKAGDTVKIVKAKLRLEKNSNGEVSNPLKVGEKVYAIGNPLGTLGGTVTQGMISSTDREVNVEGKDMHLIQTDCAINSGNSGGGLFDVNGNLVGVVNAGYSGSVEGLNFAIPSDIALDIFTKLVSTYTGKNYGYIEGRAKFTLVYGNLSGGADLAVYDYTNFFHSYVYVTGVNSIYKDLFKTNDIIKTIQLPDEKKYSVTSATSLVSYINSKSYKIDDEIIFEVERDGNLVTVQIKLEQYIYNNTGVYSTVE